MQEKLERLKTLTAQIVDLVNAGLLLEWDQETYMPPGGAEARAEQLATLEEYVHRLASSDEIGALLDDLEEYAEDLDYDSDEAAMIRVARRDYEQRVKVPAELAAEIQRTASRGLEAWKQARETDDFSLFQPWLDKMVGLKLAWAACFQPYDDVYDPLLDEYEPGIDRAQIAGVFDGLGPALADLVAELAAHQDAVDDSAMYGHWDHDQQLAFGREVAAELGYDFDRGRLDLSAHPFTTDFGRGDVRITTRVMENYLPSSLMSTIHESGHAIYEQNVAPELTRTVLGNGTSMSVHESQSRFYENVLGRSLPFWRHFYPKARAYFPQLNDVPLETFYRALNKSQPSLIRVEADEVTYGLHIILRFRLEDDLLNGRLDVADLPAAWDAAMQDLLGITPDDDRNGVLQDIHWSHGLFGYFPDYLLGSVFSVQLWDAMRVDLPHVDADIEAGRFDGILGWLREKIHRHGRKYTLPELAERVTGGPLRWEPYIAYLRDKYGAIYGLDRGNG
jgi:carboxypeptidase Taq